MAMDTGLLLEQLEKQLRDVETEIDEIQATDDPKLVETRMSLAGRTAKMWGLRRRIAGVRADYRAEQYADGRHHEWETQFARLAAKLGTDRNDEAVRLLKKRMQAGDAFAALQ